MRKGFTLVELLAVMVVLAVIALIATPVVLEIIEGVKESATLRSAEMYLNAVENSIMKHNMLTAGSFRPDFCTVNSGNLSCSGTEVKVEVNGETPKDGSTLRFENGKVSELKFVYEENTVVQNSMGVLELVAKFCKLIDDADSSNSITAGDKYECEVKEGLKYNFFVLKTPVNPLNEINLIMDRNVCEDGNAATEENKCFVAYNSSGNAAGVGPVTAMTYLNKATSTWSNVSNLNLTYDDEGGYFADFVLNGKARLPYKSEISDYDSTNKTNLYLYNYLNLSGGIQKNSISGIQGYWTLSSHVNNSTRIWVVLCSGLFTNRDSSIANNYGVRPVISITSDNIIK